MHTYNKIHILLLFLLHVSALIAQSSGSTIYMLEIIVSFVTTWVCNFCTFTFKKCLFQRGTWDVKVPV